jgi:hypothetical protein
MPYHFKYVIIILSEPYIMSGVNNYIYYSLKCIQCILYTLYDFSYKLCIIRLFFTIQIQIIILKYLLDITLILY